MDFNPEASTKSTFIVENNKDGGENSIDPTRATFGNSPTFLIPSQSSQDSRENKAEQASSVESEKKCLECNGSCMISQDDSSSNVKKINSPEEKFPPTTEIDSLLKKRLSSIAEARESDSYYDFLKSMKDKLIEETVVLENSKEYISERNSTAEMDTLMPVKLPGSSKLPPKKSSYFDGSNLYKSNPVITSETQLEIYRTLNLDKSTSGNDILRELENRKNVQDRSVTMSLNLEKNMMNHQPNPKKFTMDDNLTASKANRQGPGKPSHKSHKTFQNFNYSANMTSIIREDPLKKIEQEYEEVDLINDKSLGEGYLTSIPQKSFSSEKPNYFNPLRIKNLEIFHEISFFAKANFVAICSNEEYIACGTDKGLITVIEHRKTTPGGFTILGNTSEFKNKGVITCMHLGYQNKLLAVGYSSGLIAIFNLEKGKLLKKTKSVFKKERVKQVSFLPSSDPINKGFFLFAFGDEGKLNKIFFYKTKNLGRKKIKKQATLIPLKLPGLLMQIDPFFIDYDEKNQKKNYSLILTTNVKIFAQNLETNQIEFELEKPNILNTNALPFVIYDQTDALNYQGQPIKNRFLVAWGVFFFFVGYTKPLNPKENPWRIYKFLVIDSELIFATIISSQIILGINFEKKIFLLHFEELIEGDLKKIDLSCPLSVTQHSIKDFCGEIDDFFLHLTKSEFEFAQKSLISNDFNHSNVYFLARSDIFCINLISWEMNIKNYMEEGEYVAAMANMVQIYKNKVKYLGDIPADPIKRKKLLSGRIQEITVGFFLHSFKRIQEDLVNYRFVKEIATTIEFLIETEHFDYLFNNIMKDLELRGFLKQFTFSLEPFILKKKIKYVPESALMTLTNFLIAENQHRLADKLIVTLDIKLLDCSHLIILCLENHLFKGLIHLCSDSDDNFMIPLIKILSLYLHKSANLRLSFEDIQDLKYRCLWYIQMCLKGRLINGELMPLEKWKKAIRHVVDWIINPENFINFLKLDSDVSFKLLFMLFKGYPYQVIKKSLDYFNFKHICKDPNETIYYMNPASKNRKSQANEEIIRLKRSHDKLITDPLNYMIEFIITNEKTFAFENPFYAEHKRFAFLAFIIQLYQQAGDYNIDPKIGFYCVQFFLENPEKLDLDQIYESETARFLLKDELEIKKSECLMQILRVLPEGADANPFIEKLLATHSPLSGVTLFLLMKKQNYLASFELFIKTKNPLFKNKVFDWLFNTIAKLEIIEEDVAAQLKQSVLSRSAELVSVNCHKAHKLFQKYIPSEEKNIIFSLTKYPKLAIEYISHVIRTHFKDPQFSLEDDLAIFYAELLVQENKLKRLSEEVRSKTIRLEIAKEILSKYNISEKFAHLQDSHLHTKD